MANFEHALAWMREGKRVRRASWPEGVTIEKERQFLKRLDGI